MLSDKTYDWLFNGIQTSVVLENNQQVVPINFDNAATTPPFKQVDDFISQNILMYGSVGRGGHKSAYCTQAYEISKQEILKFFGVDTSDEYEVIYVKNTTEGINLLAYILCSDRGTKILSTRMEHHANDLPWRQHAHVYYCEVSKEGRINFKELEEKLKRAQGTISYVTISGASNVTGYITPIHEVAKIVHQYGARLIVDAAQLIAHRKINILGANKEESLDALVFSGHKMYAPFGEGVVVVKRDLIEGKSPYLQGGGTVSYVFDDDVYYKPSPYKDEAGTPNFLGAMAIVAAMQALNKVGYPNIKAHEDALCKHMLEGLLEIPKVVVYGEHSIKERLGVISFNLQGYEPYKLAQKLQDKRAIAVRSGCFCAQPYVMRLLGVTEEERYRLMNEHILPQPGMVRISFGLYNTLEEVETFLEILADIAKA